MSETPKPKIESPIDRAIAEARLLNSGTVLVHVPHMLVRVDGELRCPACGHVIEPMEE